MSDDVLAELPAESRAEVVAEVRSVLDVDAEIAEELIRSAEPMWNAMERAGGLVDSWGGGEFCSLFPQVLAFIRDSAQTVESRASTREGSAHVGETDGEPGRAELPPGASVGSPAASGGVGQPNDAAAVPNPEPTFALSAVFGGPGPAGPREALIQLGQELREASRSLETPLKVNVQVHFDGRYLQADFAGSRRGRFSRKERILKVQVAVGEPDPERPRAQLLDAVRTGMACAQAFAVAEGMVGSEGLAALHALVAQVAGDD